MTRAIIAIAAIAMLTLACEVSTATPPAPTVDAPTPLEFQPATAQPAEVAARQQPSPTPELLTVLEGVESLHVRAAASTSARVIAVVSAGDTLVLRGQASSVDGGQWYMVKLLTGRIGYVNSKFVTKGK